jgi:hypothetical protein
LPLPPEAFNIQFPLDISLGEVTLLGYDLYKLGHRSDPQTTLFPGDPVHLVTYWTARQPLEQFEAELVVEVVPYYNQATAVAVNSYPVVLGERDMVWQPGETMRVQSDFFLTNLEPGLYRLALSWGNGAVSSGQRPALTAPFRIE